MIPRKLQLHNFLSYRDCTVDFTGLHMVVLSGKNGDGKSALLDAMTWALWGEARGKRNDERIHLDQDEMSVDFEFEVDRDRFAIVRKRTRGKGTGELHLFQVDDTGTRKTMTGGVMAETQAEINRAVRMEYETFVNSAFIAQGRSNEFTRRTPADRKQVFRKLLGLERYEVLSKAAREEQKRVQGAAKELDSLLTEARAEVQKLPEIEAELAANACARKELQPRLEAVAREEADLRASVARQDQTERVAHDAQELVTNAEAELERCARELESLRDALAGAELLLASGDEVKARYEELKALRAEESRLAKLQEQAHAEQKVIADAEHEVALDRQRLQDQAETAREEVAKAEKASAELPGLEASLAECAARRATVDELRNQAAAAREQRHELAGAAAAAKATAEALKAEGHQIKARRDELTAAGATCPVCLQALTADQVEHVRDEYTTTLADLGKRYRAADAEAAAADEAADKAAALATRHDAEAQALEKEIGQEELTLRSRVDVARTAIDQHDRLTTLLQELVAILEAEEFASAARESAANARKLLATLGYDAAEYASLRGRLGLLAGADEAYQDLQQAHTRAEGLRSHIAGDERALGDRKEQLRGHRSALEKARTELEGLVDARPRLERAEC
ncbi:MAG: SMC family ATPase, partial [Dehalococcoidia bacterium]